MSRAETALLFLQKYWILAFAGGGLLNLQVYTLEVLYFPHAVSQTHKKIQRNSSCERQDMKNVLIMNAELRRVR